MVLDTAVDNNESYTDTELEPLRSEVERAINSLKDRKSPGCDEITAEMIKTKCYRRMLRIPWIEKRKKHRNPKRAKSGPGLVIEQHQSKETFILRPRKKTRLPRKAHIGGKA